MSIGKDNLHPWVTSITATPSQYPAMRVTWDENWQSHVTCFCIQCDAEYVPTSRLQRFCRPACERKWRALHKT